MVILIYSHCDKRLNPHSTNKNCDLLLTYYIKEVNDNDWFSDGHGHYAVMDKTNTRAGYSARLVTPYINTTGKCLELFYWITEEPSDDVETSLTVFSISENHTEDDLDTVSNLTPYFPKLHLLLPDGIHRIAVEGKRTEKRKLSTISLDDVTIMDCDRFGKMNTNKPLI